MVAEGSTDARRPGTSPAFDRIAPPQRSAAPRDGLGKEALYSTAPSAAPTSQVELRCRRCDVPFGLSLLGVARLLTPPFLVDPVRRRLYSRCPSCGRYAWLEVRTGQALRVLRAPWKPTS
ncbi:MAG: hypothetical protein EA387_06465 [Nitriliruptor sp.]|nr:MAG: hypothetical protein EA387_06465 [Nitriliruptor sp.]